jgi:hypothetical protein
MLNNRFVNRLNRLRRSPLYCLRKKLRHWLGSDNSWLQKGRNEFPPGTWQWLALSEIHFGGARTGESSRENMGGDRMSPVLCSTCHGYGEVYEKFLRPIVAKQSSSITLVEVGILNGTGLAIWCDLFPEARVIGLDLDLSNFHLYRPNLEKAGAFQRNKPEVYAFNQLEAESSADMLKKILGNNKIHIVIDDGCHSLESIETTFSVMQPFLDKHFIYFIEDNLETCDYMRDKNKEFKWRQFIEMSVVTGK